METIRIISLVAICLLVLSRGQSAPPKVTAEQLEMLTKICVGGPCATDEALRAPLDALRWLASAKDSTELKARFRTFPDAYIVRVIFWTRARELRMPRSSHALLELIPQDADEAAAIYNALNPPSSAADPPAGIYEEFYNFTARLSAAHPRYIKRYLRLLSGFKMYSNVDEFIIICGDAAEIYRRNPAAYKRALQQLPAQYRKYPLQCRRGIDGNE